MDSDLFSAYMYNVYVTKRGKNSIGNVGKIASVSLLPLFESRNIYVYMKGKVHHW